ncbi:MAG: hypothetical protein QXU97_05790 [Fervidicoccaceae archaeon]
MSRDKAEPGAEIAYYCARCGKELRPEDFELLHGIKCVYCGSRVIYKARKPSVKRVEAI